MLSIGIAMDIQPGTPTQCLHRDDKNHQARHIAASSYEYSSNVMLGSLYHGGGEYNRMDGKSRTMHIMFCCSGDHRQEGISFLSYPIEDIKTYSPLVQQRLGWKQSEPNLGWLYLDIVVFSLLEHDVSGQ